jgi:hypothetical protein
MEWSFQMLKVLEWVYRVNSLGLLVSELDEVIGESNTGLWT